MQSVGLSMKKEMLSKLNDCSDYIFLENVSVTGSTLNFGLLFEIQGFLKTRIL